MSVTSRIDLKRILGRSPEALSIEERTALQGRWVALEIYSPATLPLRRIEAAGESAADCIRQLMDRGLDPRKFEFSSLEPPH